MDIFVDARSSFDRIIRVGEADSRKANMMHRRLLEHRHFESASRASMDVFVDARSPFDRSIRIGEVDSRELPTCCWDAVTLRSASRPFVDVFVDARSPFDRNYPHRRG